MARAKSFHENQCPQDHFLFLQKFFGRHRCSPSASPRRLHTARIDVKLCEDVADDARRRFTSLKVKKKKMIPPGVEPGIFGSEDRRLIH